MSVLDKVRALGSEFTPDLIQKSIALFAPLVARPTEADVIRDLEYGPDARHRLDLFKPAGSAQGHPVVAFVHGGGFVGGEKGGPDAPFYNNFGAWAAREGFLGATVTYRLAPAHRFPAGAEDIAAATRWLRHHASEYGGDPEKIVLVGQSAGAAHVAAFVGYDRFREEAEHLLAGAVCLSGIYDIARAERNQFQAAYFGEDEAEYDAQSSLRGLAKTRLPVMFTVAENDPPDFQRQALWAVEEWVAAKDRWPHFAWLPGHNHITPVLQLGTPEDDLGPRLKSFVERL